MPVIVDDLCYAVIIVWRAVNHFLATHQKKKKFQKFNQKKTVNGEDKYPSLNQRKKKYTV